LRTEDLIGNTALNKENSQRRRRTPKKKKLTKEEIASKNSKIGAFFKSESSKKKKSSNYKAKIIHDIPNNNIVDIVNENKIVEEIQNVPQNANTDQNVSNLKENKETNEILKNYTPPKLDILNEKSSLPKPKTISTNIHKIPKKEEFPYNGKLFVISGKLKVTEDRKEMQNFLLFWGMIKRTMISRKTDMLIHGYILDDGRPYDESGKFKKAKKFDNVSIISEEGLCDVFKEFTGFTLEENFNKYNEDVDNYPGNLYGEAKQEVEQFEIEEEKEPSKIGKRRLN
jgi:hypothetical protein